MMVLLAYYIPDWRWYWRGAYGRTGLQSYFIIGYQASIIEGRFGVAVNRIILVKNV
jgi:hypothetical protein